MLDVCASYCHISYTVHVGRCIANKLLEFAFILFLFFKQKTAYEVRISDWSSDVCSSDHLTAHDQDNRRAEPRIGNPERRGLIDQARGDCDKIGRASCRDRVCQYV